MENKVKVIGVGSGGCNMVNYIFKHSELPISYSLCSADTDSLSSFSIEEKIDIDEKQLLSESNIEKIKTIFNNEVRFVFIVVGMGGKCGIFLTPIIANIANNKGLRTIVVATIPFHFEGKTKINVALERIKEMKKNTKAMLIIDNQQLMELHRDISVTDAFQKIDEMLIQTVEALYESLIGVDSDDSRILNEVIEGVINSIGSPLIREEFVN